MYSILFLHAFVPLCASFTHTQARSEHHFTYFNLHCKTKLQHACSIRFRTHLLTPFYKCYTLIGQSSQKIQLNKEMGKAADGEWCNTGALPGRKGRLLVKNINQEVGTGESLKQNKMKEAKDTRDLLAADKEIHTYKSVLIKCVEVSDDSYQNICLCSQSKMLQADPQQIWSIKKHTKETFSGLK